MEVFKDGSVSRYKTGLKAVSTSKILRHYYSYRPFIVRDEQNLGMIGSEITVFYGLLDERPKDKSFIRGLEIEYNIEGLYQARFFNKENTAQKFLGDRK